MIYTSAMAKGKGKRRMAGNALKNAEANIVGGHGRYEVRSDTRKDEFPVGNKKGQGKHQKIRDDWMKSAYSDGQIDYYADKGHYNKVFKAVGKNTNLNFNRVKDPSKADILNFTGGQSHEFSRKTNITEGRFKGQEITYGAATQSHGEKAAPGSQWQNARGLSAAWNPKGLSTNTGENLPINDYFQTNTVGNVKGLDKSKQWKKAGTNWHEVGHSLGLAGDRTLPKTDKSVMSYNPERQTKFDNRDYKAINKFWKPYTTGKAYK